MDISHVLSLVSPDTSGDSKKSKEKGLNEGDALLFSLLLSDILSIKPEAKEQIAEESSATSLFSTQSNSAENILGQNMYQQIIQRIVPAGKDANSGLDGEQNQKNTVLSQIALSVVQGGMDEKNLLEALKNTVSLLGEENNLHRNLAEQIITAPNTQPKNNQTNLEKVLFDTVLPLKDIGLEGIKNSIPREISSLSPAELDKYISTLELLKELSGQIKLTDSQKPVLSEMLNKISYLIPQQPQQQSLGKENTEQVKVSEIMPGDKKSLDSVIKATEGSNVQTQLKDNSNRSFDFVIVEDQKLDNKKVAEVNGILEPKNSSIKASADEMLTKPEPQLINPGQHTVTKLDGSPVADKAILSPEMPSLISGKVWDQVMGHLRKQEYSQVKELSIQLHPADLGKVNVSVRLENGQVHLVINATESSTSTFLQNNLTDLRNGLSQNGIDCGSLEMGSNDSGQFSSNREFNTEEEDSLSRLPDEEKNYYPGFVSAMSANSSGSRINLKA